MIATRIQSVFRGVLVSATMLTAWLCSTTTAIAVDPLHLEMGVLADQVVKVVKDRDEKSIAIGQFTGPTALQSSSGPGIAFALADELTSRGIQVSRRSRLQVEGKYSPVVDAESKEPAIMIEGHVIERSGDVAGKLNTIAKFKPRALIGNAVVTQLIGGTVQVIPASSSKEKLALIAPRIDDNPDPNQPPPPAIIRGTVLRPAPDSPFGLEIQLLKDAKYEPQPLTDSEGLAFVKIARDEIYAVRIINDAPYDVSVTLTIDGINIFRFSDHKEYSYFIIDHGKGGLIKGWHRTNEVSDSFQVTEYSKSAVAEVLQSDASVGTITAVFKAAWPKDESPPSDEGVSLKEMVASRSADATGRGPQTNAKYNVVERVVGQFRSSISIRYRK